MYQRRVRISLRSGQVIVSPAHAGMHETLETIDVPSSLPENIGVHHVWIRRDLDSVGETIGPDDLRFAADARTAGLTAVTRSEWEFGRVPGVRGENWQGG